MQQNKQVNRLLFIGIFASTVIPMTGMHPAALPAVVIASALATQLILYLLGTRHLMVSACAVVMLAGYMPRLGAALSKGVEHMGLRVDQSHVALAWVMLFLFLTVGCVLAVNVSRLIHASPLPGLIGSAWPKREAAVIAALAAMAVMIGEATVRTGLWTSRDVLPNITQTGGFRPELLYMNGLCVATVVAFRQVVNPEIKGNARRGWIVALCTAVFLLFIFQSRLLLLSTATVCGIHLLYGQTGPSKQMRITPTQWKYGALVAFTLLVAVPLSNAWRQGILANPGASLSTRLTNTADNVGRVQSGDVLEELDGRLQYLWMDGVAIQYADYVPNVYGVRQLLWIAIIRALPTVISDAKQSTPPIWCDTVLADVGIADNLDLPCTATAETYIFGGLSTWLVTVTLWGLFLGIADALFRRGTLAGVALGVVTANNYFRIESSLFPGIESLRELLIWGGLLLALSWAAMLVLGAKQTRTGRSGWRPAPPELSP